MVWWPLNEVVYCRQEVKLYSPISGSKDSNDDIMALPPSGVTELSGRFYLCGSIKDYRKLQASSIYIVSDYIEKSWPSLP